MNRQNKRKTFFRKDDGSETEISDVSSQLSGLEKAAILMISLGAETASKLYSSLSDEEIEVITKAIVSLDNVTSEVIDSVLDEFFQMIVAEEYIKSGGVVYAQKLLEDSIGTDRALEVIRRVQRMMKVKGFNVLKDVDPDQLLTFIQKEHPQTIAFVISQLNTRQASEILANLEADLQTEVVKRLALMDRVSPESVNAVAKVLETRIETISGTTKSLGGLKSVADLLNNVGVSVSQKIIGDITEADYDLATKIKNLMFTFEDIVQLDNSSIQKVLKEVENKDLTYALKGQADEVSNKILGNLSERARAIIEEEMEYLGAVRLSEVEEAQKKIVEIINKLKDDGQIVIIGGSNAEELVE